MHDDAEASGTTQSCINLEMTVVKKKKAERKWEPSRHQNVEQTRMKEWDCLSGQHSSLSSVHRRHVSTDDVDTNFTGASSENKWFGGPTM